MTRTIRIPDPVYDRLTREAEKNDISRGAIVKDWMEKSDKFDEIEALQGGRV